MAKLGDIATYINGYAFKPQDWSDEGIPIIRIQDLTGNSYQANRYNGEYASKYEVNDGDVLISWSASLGVYVWHGEKAVLNQHIFKVVFDKERISKDFFVHQVGLILENAASDAHGATMKHLTKPVFDALSFYLPPYEKQCEIAEILDKVTSLISLRKQQLAKLDELVKARFVEMFGNPASNTMGWKSEQLVDCLQGIDNGKSFVCSNDTRQGQEPAMLKLSAVTYGVYNQKENKVLLDDTMFIKAAEVHKGDLLFTRKNTPELVGMCAYVTNTEPNLMMPDLIFRLNPNDKINAIFLWKLINHELFREKIQNIATGSAKSMSNISKERLGKLKIIVPPIPLQNQFATFMEHVDQQKQTVQQSLEKLELMKKALMQEYFG